MKVAFYDYNFDETLEAAESLRGTNTPFDLTERALMAPALEGRMSRRHMTSEEFLTVLRDRYLPDFGLNPDVDLNYWGISDLAGASSYGLVLIHAHGGFMREVRGLKNKNFPVLLLAGTSTTLHDRMYDFGEARNFSYACFDDERDIRQFFESNMPSRRQEVKLVGGSDGFSVYSPSADDLSS